MHYLRMRIAQCFVHNTPDDKGGGDGDQGGDGKKPEVDPNAGKQITMTQDELNTLITQRLERDRKARKADWEAEQLKAKEDAEKTEAERLKSQLAEKDAANANALIEERKANALLKAENLIISMGVKAENLTAVLRLADVASIELTEDGKPNVEAITTAIATTLKQYPVFKTAGVGNVDAGEQGDGAGSKSYADIEKMSPEDYAAWRKSQQKK